MQNEKEKQELVARAAICIAKAMEAYAKTGEEDYFLVGRLLTDCMQIISDKMTPSNQASFAAWLTKKTEETRA